MDFQIVDDKYFSQIIERLKDLVPEFQSVFDEQDGAYLILGEFGRYIIENISNDLLLSKCTEFINEAISKGKYDTEDAIVIQVFQQLYNDNFTISKVRENLSPMALRLFDKFHVKHIE